MPNIGRSDEWKRSEVRIVLDKMLSSNPELFEKISTTMDFSYWFNVLCILAYKRTWSAQEVQDYLRNQPTKKKPFPAA